MFRRRFPSVKFHEYGHCLGVACVGRGQSRWCFVLNFDVCKRVHLNDFIINLISFRVFFGVLGPSPPPDVSTSLFPPGFSPPEFSSSRVFLPLGETSGGESSNHRSLGVHKRTHTFVCTHMHVGLTRKPYIEYFDFHKNSFIQGFLFIHPSFVLLYNQ